MNTTTETVDLINEELTGNIVRTALFAALMAAFAYVSFPNPVSPAPVTLQVLGVFLAGIMLGPTWGGFAMVLYLLAGGLGAPVFSGGGAGIGYLFGPHVGFLLSFPVAAVVIGFIVHGGLDEIDFRQRRTIHLVAAMVVGVVIIYALGVAGLMFRLSLGPVEAFLVGAVAFLPAEAIKIAAAIGILRSDRLAIK